MHAHISRADGGRPSMNTPKRPGPSFRPDLKLSHFIYKGPEKRDYSKTVERIRREVNGTTPEARVAEATA